MVTRIKKVVLTLVALAALAFGGAQIAQGAGTAKAPAAPKAESTATDNDTTQSGSQSAPDTADTPDKGGAAEPAGTEAAGSEKPDSDGPGGHADEPSNPNANHEATGAE